MVITGGIEQTASLVGLSEGEDVVADAPNIEVTVDAIEANILAPENRLELFELL